jgi:hypothetical protein
MHLSYFADYCFLNKFVNDIFQKLKLINNLLLLYLFMRKCIINIYQFFLKLIYYHIQYEDLTTTTMEIPGHPDEKNKDQKNFVMFEDTDGKLLFVSHLWPFRVVNVYVHPGMPWVGYAQPYGVWAKNVIIKI